MSWATDAPILAAGFARSFGDAQLAKRLVYTYMAAAGLDQTWSGESVTATGDIQGANVKGTTAVGVGDLVLAAAMFNAFEDNFSMYIGADGSTSYSMTATPTSISEDITAASGEFSTNLPANRADAWSITSGGSSDMLVFVTTTNALAVNVRTALVSTPPANQTLTNGATITLPVGINKVVDNGGAVTGIILTAGLYDGQIINIINAAAASVTFAAASTSNVADGTNAVIAANRAISLIWDSGTAPSGMWYRTG